MAQQGMSSPYADGSMTSMFTEVVNRMASTGTPNPNNQHVAIQPSTPPKQEKILTESSIPVQEELPNLFGKNLSLTQEQKTKIVQFIIASGAALSTVSANDVKFRLSNISEELKISLV